MPTIEFWPDYGPGPLWSEDGKPLSLDSLNLPADLVVRLRDSNARYEEDKVPSGTPGDEAWLAEGTELLASARAALKGRYVVTVTESWWGEEST